MKRVSVFEEGSRPKRVLALGAHADDIEIGCGGTILRLVAEHQEVEVLWVVFAATPERAKEARSSISPASKIAMSAKAPARTTPRSCRPKLFAVSPVIL